MIRATLIAAVLSLALHSAEAHVGSSWPRYPGGVYDGVSDVNVQAGSGSGSSHRKNFASGGFEEDPNNNEWAGGIDRSLTSTCFVGSSECGEFCNDDLANLGCYAVGRGQGCTLHGGPTRNLCSSDCTPCGSTPPPTISPAPTVEVVRFWEKTCDDSLHACSPNWCPKNDDVSCGASVLASDPGAEASLLSDLAGLECNPYCSESPSNYCTDLAEMLVTNHGGVKAVSACTA
jgi:hypothetical protein